uniref:Uncharacterized protein n=1 Tax=Anguilla anguilla TaxID=7936 RepID=A0A0E9PSJ2_ANGAN
MYHLPPPHQWYPPCLSLIKLCPALTRIYLTES